VRRSTSQLQLAASVFKLIQGNARNPDEETSKLLAHALRPLLLPRLREVSEEGHEAPVFSQFTGMLSILREHLDREGIAYEYFDGKTRDRQACVEREEALDDSDLAALQNWRQATTEAALTRPADLRNCLRTVGKWLQWPNARVRWVISTRPRRKRWQADCE
jgi:hypothetical protein